MNLYALEKNPDFRKPYALVVLTGVTTIASSVALLEFVPESYWFVSLFMPAVGMAICALIVWQAITTSPFRVIETSFKAQELETLLPVLEKCRLTAPMQARWLRYGETSNLSPDDTAKAVSTFREASEQVKANGIARRIQQEQPHERPAAVN